PPSSARSRPWSGTRGCELRNLQWLVPTGRPCVFPRYFARVSITGELSVFSRVNRSSWYPWPTLARSEPTRTASAGGQLRTLKRVRAEAPRDLAIGIDAGEIDGPVWSVSGRGTAGAFTLHRVAQIADRTYCRPHARPFHLGFPRKVPVFPICPPAALK